MDRRDLNMGIVQQLKDITGDTGQFVAGILSDHISRDEQITFALRLVRLAEHIKQRAESAAGMVVEGGVVDDGGSRRPALSAGADERANHPRPAADD
ncbi:MULTISPECIES: hypothetical protein [unclassified Streptomyces]|uniref:hypothetical protein n=1 Tax=unclassified Streptomyces TaxID=2593676 RepID=UPI00081ED7F9|nr:MULTISPECIES: hypothetical protein [unclassified Streptomyces]SCF71856.1 hypothetical protein GA0115259_101505 [Streptomyces sp. MnatMP-M17]